MSNIINNNDIVIIIIIIIISHHRNQPPQFSFHTAPVVLLTAVSHRRDNTNCVDLREEMKYERRIVEAGFCGGFVAQWFMAALVRHPGFESRSCQFFAFLLSLPAG